MLLLFAISDLSFGSLLLENSLIIDVLSGIGFRGLGV